MWGGVESSRTLYSKFLDLRMPKGSKKVIKDGLFNRMYELVKDSNNIYIPELEDTKELKELVKRHKEKNFSVMQSGPRKIGRLPGKSTLRIQREN